MKIFILENVRKVSDNYHGEGGLAVIAYDLENAIKLCEQVDGVDVKAEEWERAVVTNIEANAQRVFVFPDAGCC